jgi:hypothetical protein
MEQTLAPAGSTLGADTFTAIWEEAQALPLEQILKSLPGAAMLDVSRDRAVS